MTNSPRGWVAGCTHVSGVLHGKTFTGSVAKLALTRYGDQSVAFMGTSRWADAHRSDILVVRKGKE